MATDKFKYEPGMKLIGHSLSKCVKDIVTGIVDIQDVLIIKAGTCINKPDILKDVVKHYCRGALFGGGPWEGLDENECRMVTYELFFTNRVYQERVFELYETSDIPDFLEKSNKIHQEDADHWELA